METGTVVILKSGGPHMTVMYKQNSGLFKCGWFVDKELREGSFSKESLMEILQE